MGSYLDKPETTKKSAFDENEYLEIGSSSMQGWRINQEDAHNAIPQLGENAAFFAVYDGHGGSEVAEYCSMKLPDFLKQLESFKNGNYEEALKEAFMGFDRTLLENTVGEELRQLAKKNPDYEDSEMDDMEDEETAEEISNLHQEATMPLNEVLEKYKGNVEKITRIQTVQRIISLQTTKANEAAGPSSSSSGSSSQSTKKAAGSSSTTTQPASENEVSSSSGKTNSDEEPPSSSNSAAQATNQAPDSTLVTIPSSTAENNSNEPKIVKPKSSNEVVVNQDSECSSNGQVSESKASTDDAAISSTRENGEVGSCSSSTSAENISSNTSKASPTKTAVTQPVEKIDLADTESDTSDDEHDETYKESPKKKKEVKETDDSTDEDDEEDDEDDDEEMYDEEDEEDLSNEEISGEEDDDEDGLDDAFMSSMETGPAKASGCTAVVSLLVGRDLYVANAGDSRCILCRAGKVVEMSFDHKPEDQIEFDRIRKAGGRVTMDGRVNGGLNLSRAIGDHGYKMNKELPAEDQMITAMPDLKKITITDEDEFMVLACDGIWNYMSNEEVVGFVKHRIDSGKSSLTQICEELFHNCLAPNTLGDGTGCDNMTAIIVKFKPALFKLPVSKNSENSEAECVSAHKRTHEDESEDIVEPSDKKQKLEDELTPSTVDTSS